MAYSPFASAIWADLYGDPELARLFTDSADVRAMLMVEGALAEVQGALGIIPRDAAAAIARAALDVIVDPAALAKGTASAGVPVPALVEAFRAGMGDPAMADYVHWGATTQDILDTGLVLRLRRALEILDARLTGTIATLADQADRHRSTVMAARTRGQNATPTTLGARIASWGMPLIRHRARLAELRPRVLMVSLAGASGTNAVLKGRGAEVAAGVADKLGLGHDPVPWHSTRDGLVELGQWAGLLTGSLGKMGADLLHLAQSDVAEVRAGAAGGSSTMPHKRNPVGPEVLVQLAVAAPPAVAGLHNALVHVSERDGVAWAQEWLHLPMLIALAGRALLGAQDLARTLEADAEAMARPFAAHQGTMFAEAASFALAEHMPRPKAQALVKAACGTALSEGVPLRAVLARESVGTVDWDAVFDPLAQAGDAPGIADAFVAAARKTA